MRKVTEKKWITVKDLIKREKNRHNKYLMIMERDNNDTINQVSV